MSGKKGLGRGFDSLIPDGLFDDSFDPTAKQDERVSQQAELLLKDVHPDPAQPRSYFDEDALAELTESVREHGVIQPIIVIRKGDGYQIVAGERRFRAATAAGLQKIPAIIRTLTDQNKLELSLIENLQRRDLNVIETATAYAKLREQFNLSNEEIGQRVHKSPSAVNNTMRLLKLPKEVRALVAEGKLTEGQVRPLIAWDEAFILEIIPRIIAEEWSARKVEQYTVNAKKDRPVANARPINPAYEAHVQSIRQRLNTDVAIRMNAKGAGKILINFKNEAELQRLQDLLSEN
ncbi:MAG TPA: ParB/RepB/Spo0J family partition protein [Candidatus Saccharimonadaceae bacterium]|nr:ParB/RepB/Spo0J family partition protein [Candidatus Saccharimonadaceae bacterium]